MVDNDFSNIYLVTGSPDPSLDPRPLVCRKVLLVCWLGIVLVCLCLSKEQHTVGRYPLSHSTAPSATQQQRSHPTSYYLLSITLYQSPLYPRSSILALLLRLVL